MRITVTTQNWHVMKSICIIYLTLATNIGFAQDSVKATTSVNGFVDVYYSYAFTRPVSMERSYTTQPLRHHEFNLNLGVIDLKHQASNVRGRFAFQTGTYVESNLVLEPGLLKNILEASVGMNVGKDVWIDAGIFPSHIGLEGIISKDNWTYSRSLAADYSPYYEAGVDISVPVSEKLSLRALVLNGWQNIQETNHDKAVGTQVQVRPSADVLLNWSTFIGNEQPDTSASQLRIFNDFYAQLTLSERVSIALLFDVGFQEQSQSPSYHSWHTETAMLRYVFHPQWSVTVRGESFMDKRGIIVPTGTLDNFQVFSGSMNLDFAPAPNVLWRIEARLYTSKDRIYPSETGPTSTDGFLAASAAISL
jgi:hypothetical protein